MNDLKKPRGRPPIYSEPMIRVSTRIPASAFDRFDETAKRQQQSLNERLRLLVIRDVRQTQ